MNPNHTHTPHFLHVSPIYTQASPNMVYGLGYGPDDQGFESRQEQEILLLQNVQIGSGVQISPYTMGTYVLSQK
jgi:hypothetical protein